MNKGLALILASALAGALGVHAHEGAHPEQHHGSAAADSKTATMTGEVIDISCYMDHGGKGKDHRKCAKECLLEKHVPAGLLGDDGSVTLLVADHKHEKAFKGIPGWAAERVTITGKRVEKGGLPAILVHSAEKAK